ncbi:MULTISPECIES: hypothetical protein [Streptomyces]|uniref:Holliday junction resolvase n=2 Tax=Streptomyces TaxID=1883 RepID=A0A1E7LPS0_9ACTN|nr:hypothetical protein [Streptomyces nanshensis]OEV18171.1 hypothetical protein AN221_23815 [Streptomyces nanshensis]
MANPNKAKGTAWESACRDYLNDGLPLSVNREFKVSRNAQTGVKDIGDLDAYPFTGECKAVRAYDLASFVEQAEREAENADMPFGVALVKRPRKGVGDGYAVLSIRTFRRVRARLLGVEDPGE